MAVAGLVGREAYRAVVAQAGDCRHGNQGGDVVRPWTMTPACPWCRRMHPQHWRFITTPLDQLAAVDLDDEDG